MRYKNVHGEEVEFMVVDIDRAFERGILNELGIDKLPQECYMPTYRSDSVLPDLHPYDGLIWDVSIPGAQRKYAVNAIIIGRTWVIRQADRPHWEYTLKVRII